jgi:hypothetical protein
MAQPQQRFTGRAGSAVPGRVRRALDGAVESDQRYGDGLDVAKDGKVRVCLARNSGLKTTKRGLEIDVNSDLVGDKNREALNGVKAFNDTAAATTTELADKMNELLREMRRVGEMKGV